MYNNVHNIVDLQYFLLNKCSLGEQETSFFKSYFKRYTEYLHLVCLCLKRKKLQHCICLVYKQCEVQNMSQDDVLFCDAHSQVQGRR